MKKTFTYSLYIITFGSAFAFIISGVLANSIIEYFGLTGAAQGYMSSIINSGYTIAIFLTIVIYFKPKITTMLYLSSFMIVLTLALTGFAGSFSVLLIVSGVLGLGLGWFDSYVNSCVVAVNPKEGMKHQSTLHGFYGVGAILAPIVTAALLLIINWQSIYFTFTILFLVTLIVYMISLKNAAKHLSFASLASPKLSGNDILSYLKDKRQILVLAACFSYNIMQAGLFAWLVRYISVQYDAEALGIIGITLMWFGRTVCLFIAPRLPVGMLKLYSFGALISGASLLIGIFSGSPLVMCFMVGIGSLTSGHSLPTMINKSIAFYKGGSLLPTSAMLLVTRAAGIVTPPVLGLISLYSMQASMILLVIAIFLSAVFSFILMRIKPAN